MKKREEIQMKIYYIKVNHSIKEIFLYNKKKIEYIKIKKEKKKGNLKCYKLIIEKLQRSLDI